METQEMQTKTFREVHAELESEYLFLKKKHNVNDFKQKADFLKKSGFSESISTKIYSAVSENQQSIQEFDRKYKGLYKLILNPQLERVCEKYNLYVRETRFFLGDIPEKNIKDMMNFFVYVEDLRFVPAQLQQEVGQRSKNIKFEHDDMFHEKAKISLSDFSHFGLQRLIKIAAVKNLFSPDAFKDSQARIVLTSELVAKNKVIIDPIVLCETKYGDIIITAWGDEANDELVCNPNQN